MSGSAKLIKWLGLAIAALLTTLLFQPVRQLWLWLFHTIGITWDILLDLLQVSFVAFIFAALLSPLEALGWWAGWYGDQIDTAIDPGELVKPLPVNTQASRYVIYLDGISQTNFEYLPDAAAFLVALEERLPDDILIVKGLMPYSPFNRPLTAERLLSFFWRLADYFQVSRSGGIIGLLIGFTIQLRNLTVVAVSVDRRYGPIYNQGTAQVIYNSLLNYGYQPQSKVPITLVGYSGGGQMALGAAPYIRRALNAPIDVISISGVFSGSNNFLQLGHFYHFVGNRDVVERLGQVLFPHRWPWLPLSYWNRAKRYGKITITSLGPVGHSSGFGPFSQDKHLPDGRTYFEQTIDMVADIIDGDPPLPQRHQGVPSNYELYQQAEFNRPNYYPLQQTVEAQLYRPIAPWMGRLILPSLHERRVVKGAWFEVHHAAPEYQHLVGRILKLQWSSDPRVITFLRRVTQDVHFSDATKYSEQQGIVHPWRIDHWQQVNPLESLAASHDEDDVIVALKDPIVMDRSSKAANQSAPDAAEPVPTLLSAAFTLVIDHDPVQITGRYYALVKIIQPIAQTDRFRVIHFNHQTREFDGIEEVVRFPAVVLAQAYGVYPSTTHHIEQSPVNESGWYIYGAKDNDGWFVVQAIAPRALRRLHADAIITGESNAWHYLKKQAWQVKGQKGLIQSVLLLPEEPEQDGEARPIEPATTIAQHWQVGDRALVVHTYGGIGGRKKEPAARTPIFFGHFAYGIAEVVHEPLADELMFHIEYYQVYTHNTDGIIAGTIAWERFLGDRQVGWLGTRPTCDLIIKLESFTGELDVYGVKQSPLDTLIDQLMIMTARYRIGAGTGGTYVGPAHNCSQDSNQALYTAIKTIVTQIKQNVDVRHWLTDDPEQADPYHQLVDLGNAIRYELMPLGSARADWEGQDDMLGISPEEDILKGLMMGLGSWKTLLPRLASETIAHEFLKQGALIWVLRTNQVGGYDPNIEPIAPTPIGW